jgi:hypothetical protein
MARQNLSDLQLFALIAKNQAKKLVRKIKEKHLQIRGE